MADFDLKVEVSATTAEFDAAIAKMEAEVEEMAASAEQGADTVVEQTEGMSEGFVKAAETAAKVVAAMAAFEMAAGLAGAATALLSGNTEQLRTALTGLPIVGGFITKIYEFGDALEYASDDARNARERIVSLDIAMQDLSVTMQIATEELAIMERRLELAGATELEIATDTHAEKMRLLELESTERQRAIREQFDAEVAAIEEAGLAREDYDRLVNEANERRRAAVAKENELLVSRKALLDDELRAIRNRAAAEEAAAQAAADAAAEAEADAQSEAHRQRMEDEAVWLAEHMRGAEEAQRARDEALAAERAERLRIEEEVAAAAAAYAERVQSIQAEIDASRLEAESAVRGASASFSTAGGSFTTAVTAQVDQQKVLAKISQQSRDFLAQIAQNTAAFGGVGFA